MIRHSNPNSTIRLTNPNAPTEAFSPLEKEYRELLDLREQVKKAEAAAKRLGPRGELKTCDRPVARVVSRRPITRWSGELTKRQLYDMLAEAVRNTQLLTTERASPCCVENAIWRMANGIYGSTTNRIDYNEKTKRAVTSRTALFSSVPFSWVAKW